METMCVVVAEVTEGLVAVPMDRAGEQLAYAVRMRAKAADHRALADKYDALADNASRIVKVVA